MWNRLQLANVQHLRRHNWIHPMFRRLIGLRVGPMKMNGPSKMNYLLRSRTIFFMISPDADYRHRPLPNTGSIQGPRSLHRGINCRVLIHTVVEHTQACFPNRLGAILTQLCFSKAMNMNVLPPGTVPPCILTISTSVTGLTTDHHLSSFQPNSPVSRTCRINLLRFPCGIH